MQRCLTVVWTVAAGIALAGGGRPLAAAPRDPKAVAKLKLVEGARLLGQGEYDEALQRFQEAYASVPSPKIFYNFGLAYRGLGRNAEAIAAFDRFLGEASDAAPDKRADAERRRTELVKKVAIIEVSSDDEGAEIVVDGTSYGQTPRTTPIYLDSGNHLLSLRKGGLQHVQRLTLERGQKQTIVINFPAPASAVAGRTPGAEATRSAAIVPPVGPIAGPATPPPNAGEATSSRGGALRVAAWSTGAAAVAFLAGGTIETVSASHKLDEFGRTLAPDSPGRSCGVDQPRYGGGACVTLHDDWSRARTLGLVGLVGGGVLAATSATLFVLSASHGDPAGDRKVACAPMLAATGILCATRF